MISSECFFSGYCDEVSCAGKETWTQLSELKKKTNNSKTFSDGESFLEVILLRADMFFQHKFDSANAFVCDAHHKKLFQQVYFYKVKSKCDTCLSVRGTPLCAKADLRHITVSQAITLFEVFTLVKILMHAYSKSTHAGKCHECS